MNLLDFAVTPMWRVFEEVGRLAREAGVEPAGSELIGLVPQAALLATADHAGVDGGLGLEGRLAGAAGWLRMTGFEPDMALELRLARARDGAGQGASAGASGVPPGAARASSA